MKNKSVCYNLPDELLLKIFHYTDILINPITYQSLRSTSRRFRNICEDRTFRSSNLPDELILKIIHYTNARTNPITYQSLRSANKRFRDICLDKTIFDVIIRKLHLKKEFDQDKCNIFGICNCCSGFICINCNPLVCLNCGFRGCDNCYRPHYTYNKNGVRVSCGRCSGWIVGYL